MLNALSAQVFDLDGHIMIDIVSVPDRDVKRRVNRALTLDGGVSVTDGGYADGDLTFELEWKTDAEVDTLVRRLLQLYSRITLSTRDGVFDTAVETYRIGSSGTSTLRCLAIRRLSA